MIPMNSRIWWLTTLALMLTPTGAIAQDSATALSRDGTVVMVNKDVNGERWAISYDPSQHYVSGNVLLPSGGVDFIDCTITRDVPEAVDLTCYGGTAGWVEIGNVTLSRAFLGNWPIGGNANQPTPHPTPRPTAKPTPQQTATPRQTQTPLPEPASCVNIRGVHPVYGTGALFACEGFGCTSQAFINQVGCRLTSQFATGSGTLTLSATINRLGIVAGSITRAPVFGSSALTVLVEGRGTVRGPSATLYRFDYYGGALAGTGYISVSDGGSASAAFLDRPVDLFE